MKKTKLSAAANGRGIDIDAMIDSARAGERIAPKLWRTKRAC